ncbi:hypothetical protein CIG2463D_1470 [Campylobacter iguaniorum]|uniref:hypothetical protein n=1 Tax=Campylobacter iguaniorum TaxID=1244531 RepID=UPI00073A1536|nr:hypothetical protein [Campylobacter iguaniorum]ALV25035.1 hypothetical protein CIG2463D_1470 [Campylobacter iguaniorum]
MEELEEQKQNLKLRIQNINNCLNGKIDNDVQSYQINGRSITKYSITELLALLDYSKKELSSLEAKTKPRKIFTRFA